MSERSIYITRFDKDRLLDLIEGVRANAKKSNANLDMLEMELTRGILVDPDKVPHDVITMNSTVQITDMDSGEKITYALVFPANADISENRLSILAPLGTALLGYRIGNIIEWTVPAGVRRLRVDDVLYQPEAAGRFDL
jgi:regulator of nucleoside diphosphate kinase